MRVYIVLMYYGFKVHGYFRELRRNDMGVKSSKCSKTLARRVVWCDTEGGVRNVPLWDVTFIEENVDGITGYRLSNVKHATKQGKLRLRKELPLQIYQTALKTGSTAITTFTVLSDSLDTFQADTHATVNLPIHKMVVSYLASRSGSVLVAWNMNGHDKHVLRRAAGAEAVDKVTLWDALPWFRSKYTLPKNTMSSSKAGTPRAAFSVPTFGAAHSSLSDTVHLRQVVLRAAYCHVHNAKNINCHNDASTSAQFAAACAQIEESNAVKEWAMVSTTAWIPGLVPNSVCGI